jgi:hypothetical protein
LYTFVNIIGNINGPLSFGELVLGIILNPLVMFIVVTVGPIFLPLSALLGVAVAYTARRLLGYGG